MLGFFPRANLVFPGHLLHFNLSFFYFIMARIFSLCFFWLHQPPRAKFSSPIEICGRMSAKYQRTNDKLYPKNGVDIWAFNVR